MEMTNWLPFESIPRDGTTIETKNNYGLMPTYSLVKWVEGRGWTCVRDERISVGDGPHLEWRPFTGDPATYVDPTGGAQNTAEYWDPAIARSAGISIQKLHAIREKNKQERERFGDGADAPCWPSDAYNGSFTLHRGVWCNDAYPVPSRFVLWKVRREHRKKAKA